MILGSKSNDGQLMAMIPSIKNNMNEWQIVNVMTSRASKVSSDEILGKLMNAYKDYEGIVYTLRERRIVCLIRLGVVSNYANIKNDLEKKMPNYSCHVIARKMSPMGLKQIQADLSSDKDNEQSPDMFQEREGRKKNVLMVADDDIFVRKVMSKVLDFYGEFVEVDSGDQVIAQYIKHNPDMILLDIHMPGKNGLELVDEIMEVDPDAFIIVFSADSVAENVLEAMEKGAVGFVSKPPKKDKVIGYLNRCITIQ